MDNDTKSEQPIIVNEKTVTSDELEKMKKDNNIRLVQETDNKYRILERMYD